MVRQLRQLKTTTRYFCKGSFSLQPSISKSYTVSQKSRP
nr:MAG TPA: hypothetical protein [Caudoviricetes sp.]